MKSPPVVLGLVAALLPCPSPGADKMKPEEVVARHLDAVGPAEARAAARHVVGSSAMTAVASAGVAGALLGRFAFDSEGARSSSR